MKNFILSLLVISTLNSCGPSTKVVKSWVEPGASFTKTTSNKTLIIAMVKDETARRVIEDQLVSRVGNAVASYSLLTPELLKNADEATIKQKVNEGNFTHLLMVRLADIEKETSYVPGTTAGYYGGYGRYYGYGAAMYSTPGYYTEDKNYFVESTVYTINPDKLVWTGTTKTVNPSKLEKTVTEIANAVSEKMQKDGFLK